MVPASASDWRTKRLGLDIDLQIITVIRNCFGNRHTKLRDQLAVGLRV